MDALKEPAMILSTLDLLGIIGSTYYFYKCNEELELKITGQQKAISILTQKMNNYEKAQQHRTEGLATLNDRIKELGETMQQLPSTEHLDNIAEDVEEIVTVLQNNDIEVELPSQMSRSKASKRSVRSDVDEGRNSGYNRGSITRSARTTDVKVRSRAANKPEQTREQTRDHMRDRDNREPRLQTGRHYEEDNDNDLIGAVRQEQGLL